MTLIIINKKTPQIIMSRNVIKYIKKSHQLQKLGLKQKKKKEFTKIRARPVKIISSTTSTKAFRLVQQYKNNLCDYTWSVS